MSDGSQPHWISFQAKDIPWRGGEVVQIVGTVVSFSPFGDSVRIRRVRAGVESIDVFNVDIGIPRRLSLLEVMASESMDDYWPNPDLRACELHECCNVVRQTSTAIYCSNRCALADA